MSDRLILTILSILFSCPQIEQKEVETLEIELKEKIASLQQLKKDFQVEQV